MVKKAKSTKSRTRKTGKSAKKVRVVAKKRATGARPLSSMLMREVSSHVFRSLTDAKSDAVNACVNAEMNKVTNSWNDGGHMDKDYHQSQKSMVAFLSDVRACLKTKNYNFNMNDPKLVAACVTAAVFQVKLLIYGRTT